MKTHDEEDLVSSLPEALVTERRAGPSPGRWWPIGGLIAVLISSFLLLQGAGPTVTLVADHGHGIGPGDPIRFQGLDVGEVADVRLSRSGGVELDLRFRPDARDLARAGTRLWIVRPLLSLDAVTGLDTLLGSRYVSLDPGPPGAERRARFTALAAPPVDALAGAKPGLDLVLEAPQRHGIQPGASVHFRGVSIGAVTAVQLSSDATAVEVYVTIRSGFARLIRERTVFWEMGGVEVDLTLTRGVELGLDSLRSALVGAIAVATPPEAGAAAPGGSRFQLHEDPDPEWEAWSTPLPVGDDLLPGGARAGEAYGAVLQWREGRFLKSTRSREGWFCATGLGLLGPADLLALPVDAAPESSVLEVAGRRLGLSEIAGQGMLMEHVPGLCWISAEAFGGNWGLMASKGVGPQRRMKAAEDVLVFGAPGSAPLAISAARLQPASDGAMEVVGGPPVPSGWHGAQVLSRADGALLGLLLAPGGRAVPRVVPTLAAVDR
ncbi:MAG: MlaD family protein [Planctomycetota bacterium]|nr:MlaD family protein [Planctomycetota bacterium]